MRYMDFRASVLTTLRSTDDGGNYGEDLIYVATCGAEDAILPWVPNQKMRVETMDGVTDRIRMPKDMYRIEAIHDLRSGRILEKVVLSTRTPRPVTSSVTERVYDWLEYPRGCVYLSQVAPRGQQFRIYYLAHYPKPLDPTDELFEFSTPEAAQMGMVYYAVAHCLAPATISAALIGQFKQKVDSGTPVDNALEAASLHFLKLFQNEMARLPKYQGAS